MVFDCILLTNVPGLALITHYLGDDDRIELGISTCVSCAQTTGAKISLILPR